MRKKLGRTKKGMALVLVLWLVAALMVFATGIGVIVKREAQVAGLTQKIVAGRAVGDAVVYEMLLNMLQPEFNLSEFHHLKVNYKNHIVELEVQPWSGLIDINNAPVDLISMILKDAAKIDSKHAKELALKITENREELIKKGVKGPWESVDDLVKIENFDYSIFLLIKDFLVAGRGGGGGINPNAAKEPLRTWMNQPNWSAFSQSGSSDKNFNFKLKIYINGESQYVVIEKKVALNNSSQEKPWEILGSKSYFQLKDGFN